MGARLVDYTGPFKRSEGKQHVLVGVEIILGLSQARAFAQATRENTIKALKEWFGIFPNPRLSNLTMIPIL